MQRQGSAPATRWEEGGGIVEWALGGRARTKPREPSRVRAVVVSQTYYGGIVSHSIYGSFLFAHSCWRR